MNQLKLTFILFGLAVLFTQTSTAQCGAGCSTPSFENTPPDTTLDCGEQIPPPANLTYDNGQTGACANTGTIQGLQQNNTNGCGGGTIVNTWSGVDACGNSLNYTQTITIPATPPAQFVNMPVDMVIQCGDVAPFPQPLSFDNGDPSCPNTGTIDGVQQDITNGCQGGPIINIWSGMDACGNSLNYTQTITIPPTPPAQFINLPSSMTLQYGDIVPPLTDLVFDNGDPSCPNTGTITGTQSGPTDPCQGGVLTRTWAGIDACGNSLFYTQTITFSEDICDVNNGLPTNQQIQGNLCVAGSIHASQVMRLKPLVTPPSSPLEGTLYFDDITKKLRVWDGATWQDCW